MDETDAVAMDRRTLLRGVAGATAVGAVGGAAATGTGAAQDSQEIVVGPEGDPFTFSPDDVTIAPGTTVTFVWETGNHNVVPESRPDEASWEGHAGVEDAGFEHSHTFEVEGTYEYRCDPHAPGMVGTIEVAEGGGGGDGGGGAEDDSAGGSSGDDAAAANRTESNVSADASETDDGDGSDDSLSGFGIGAAVSATIGATLLGVRRRL